MSNPREDGRQNSDQIEISADALAQFAKIAGHTGNPLPVIAELARVQAIDAKLAGKKFAAYMDACKFLLVTRGVLTQENLRRAVVNSTLSEGLTIAILGDVLHDPNQEGSVLSRFFNKLFAE